MSEYNIKIIKALNGFVVVNNGNLDEVLLVNEDQSLGDAIMGALVSQKLSGVPSKGAESMKISEVDDLLYEKSKWEVERAELKKELHRVGQYQYASNQTSGTPGIANNAQQSAMWNTSTASSQLGSAYQQELNEALRGTIKRSLWGKY